MYDSKLSWASESGRRNDCLGSILALEAARFGGRRTSESGYERNFDINLDFIRFWKRSRHVRKVTINNDKTSAFEDKSLDAQNGDQRRLWESPLSVARDRLSVKDCRQISHKIRRILRIISYPEMETQIRQTWWWWWSQSRANPSLLISLLNREETGNFLNIGVF